MIGKNLLLLIVILFSAMSICRAQTNPKNITTQSIPPKLNAQVKSSPAFAELLLRRTERESELEELIIGYKEEFPKVKELRFELGLIRKEMDKILAVSAADSGKLTLALGKLMVRKTELETDLWNLRQQYSDDIPEVTRAKRKVEIYERAIKEIL